MQQTSALSSGVGVFDQKYHRRRRSDFQRRDLQYCIVASSSNDRASDIVRTLHQENRIVEHFDMSFFSVMLMQANNATKAALVDFRETELFERLVRSLVVTVPVRTGT